MEHPEFHIKFPHRNAGQLGTSTPAKIIDWITRKWWRFNVTSLACFIALMSLALSQRLDEMLIRLILSLPAALLIYPCWTITLVLMSFLPVVKYPVGIFRVLYYKVFSRLIVEDAPSLSVPLWF